MEQDMVKSIGVTMQLGPLYVALTFYTHYGTRAPPPQLARVHLAISIYV